MGKKKEYEGKYAKMMMIAHEGYLWERQLKRELEKKLGRKVSEEEFNEYLHRKLVREGFL